MRGRGAIFGQQVVDQKAMHPAIAVRQRMQIDEGKRHRSRAYHRIAALDFLVKDQQARQHVQHIRPHGRDVMHDFLESGLSDEHRR
ncbi:hypothetical protein D3C71_1798120 [compost metagenome]